MTATSIALPLGDHAADRVRRRSILPWNPTGPTPRHRRSLTVALATVLLGGVVAFAILDRDVRVDLAASAVTSGRLLASASWPILGVVAGLGVLHYVAAALAARAATGAKTRFPEMILVQLSASTANRLTPMGVGGNAVIARYLNKRAGLALPSAIGAVATLAVLGAVADLVAFATVVVGGRFVGLGGGASELRSLTTKVNGFLRTSQSPWVWAALALVATMAAGTVWCRRRGRSTGPVAAFLAPAASLMRRPSGLFTLLLASASTTLCLGAAFAASATLLPGYQAQASVGALIVGYMVGATAGNFLPIPAGIGATETALIAVLLAAHVPAGVAVYEVVLFRVITFWLPALVGVLATRRLRRAGAL